MPIKRVKQAAYAVSGVLDVNGDGVIDRLDALAAAKIAGVATVGLGATVAASAVAGSGIVASGATAIAAKVTAVAGAAAGGFIAATLGASTVSSLVIAQAGSALFIGTSAVTSVSSALVAFASSGGALAGQIANGFVAGMPIIQKVALSKAIASGEIIMIAGVPMGVTAALISGLIAIIIVAGYAYYVLTKDAVGQSDGLDNIVPLPA